MVKNFKLLFILVLKITQIYSEDGFCESQSDCDKSNSKIYDKNTNSYIKQIENALADYIPCSQANCSCHLDVLKRDLLPYKSGITKQMIDDVRDRGTKYQIIDHRLYRQKDCMFPTRCSGIEHFIIPLLEKLPNMELIINCRDWPQNPSYQKEKGPVFSFSKTKDYADIMYPAWSFWAGGPSISLYPTGLGRWDKHRESITKAAEKWSWERKKEKAFFRGSRTSSERDSLVLLSRRMPNLVDAKYTKNQAWKSAADTLNAEPAKEISFEDHCKFKYLFNYRGVAASFRFKHLFLCKSLVFHVGDEYDEFFYDSLKPWVHYIPVKSDSTEDDLRKLLEFFKEHDKYAQEIADRGFRHIWDNLKMKDIQCYWKKLLLRYGKLIKYDVKRDDDLIEIHK